MLAGFSSINVPEFDSHDAWLDFIFENIEAALAEYDFVYAHIKGADEAAHDKDPGRKRKIIEDIDRHLEGFKNFDGIVVLTCDHITSSESGRSSSTTSPCTRRKAASSRGDDCETNWTVLLTRPPSASVVQNVTSRTRSGV